MFWPVTIKTWSFGAGAWAEASEAIPDKSAQSKSGFKKVSL
jgi:hypothetical protein